MIFGKTKSDYMANKQCEIKAKIYGIHRFLWLPELLEDGRWVWLQTVISYYKGWRENNGTYHLVSSAPDSFFPIYKNVLIRNDKHIDFKYDNEKTSPDGVDGWVFKTLTRIL